MAADDVFASSAHLRLLADGEDRLVDVLSNYISAERRRLQQLDQLDIRALIASVSLTGRITRFACLSGLSRAGF